MSRRKYMYVSNLGHEIFLKFSCFYYPALYKQDMAIDIENLKKILWRHLETTGLTVNGFATKNGINQPTLHRFLTGENTPNVKTVNKILAGLEPWEIATNNILNLEQR